MVGLVDTHAHVMDPRFTGDLSDVLQRAEHAGVTRIVCVGYDLRTSRAAVQMARRHETLVATVGIHPNDAGATGADAYAEIASLARSPRVVAVGETGLDYYRDRTAPARQQESLEWHLSLAEELHLPLVVHTRQADRDMAGFLERSAARRASGEIPGLLHCFSSEDAGFLERMVEAGYYISFAGPLTFRGGDGLRALAQLVPMDRLLVETDCPYMAPEPVRGRRNEPAFVRHTAARLAEIRSLPYPAMVEHLWHNSVRIFPALSLGDATTPREAAA